MDTSSAELKTLDAEMARLAALVASGGSDIPAVLEALRSRQVHLWTLETSADPRPAPSAGGKS